MKARKLLTYRNQLLRNIPCPSPSISHRVPAPLTVPLGRHHKNDTLSSSTYTFEYGVPGTLVLFLILAIITPATFQPITTTTPEQTSPSSESSGCLLTKQPPPVAPIQIDVPRHRLNDGTAYAPQA
ncbi:uncharacterized protein HKW66_Vig0184860 [Vigna angularis]|uniref:Uncharacterized protein n=1 Tax=Phaseolus angularis TaxID=3914 RepID=A0A8T0KSJ0_PHAAN|nr:uncharacterized protein HKW66_Vig0184860 [Vigna angularis]